MGQALYRAYRPKSLGEVVGQEHITSSLLNALKGGKLAHAYLFTGPRGVGKTSIARILAHEINGLPYTDDSMHLDIIEIDAASNRRIDEIRELRDKVNVAPSIAKYKVYIIDEVHMLTREAFNALLKTLEEPPAHVVFILATTEIHKLPETIVSRTQRFMFKPVAQEQVVAHLRSIADKEGFSISNEALQLVAAYGEGSFRDSISLLDQTRGLTVEGGEVAADAVRTLTGVPTTEAIDAVRQSIDQADAIAASQALSTLRDQGFAAAQVAKQLGQGLRRQLLAGQGSSAYFDTMQALLEVPAAHDPESLLELVVLSAALRDSLPAASPATTGQQAVASPPPASTSIVPIAPAATPAPRPAAAKATGPKLSKLSVVTPPPAQQAEPAASISTPATPDPANNDTVVNPEIHGEPLAEVDANIWPAVVNSLKKSHNTLYGIIRMATPIFYEDAVELHFTFAFHKKRLSEAKNQEVVCGIIKQVTGRDMALRCVLDGKNTPKPMQIAVPTSSNATDAQPSPAIAADNSSPVPEVSAISNIFGGAEVLES